MSGERVGGRRSMTRVACALRNGEAIGQRVEESDEWIAKRRVRTGGSSGNSQFERGPPVHGNFNGV